MKFELYVPSRDQLILMLRIRIGVCKKAVERVWLCVMIFYIICDFLLYSLIIRCCCLMIGGFLCVVCMVDGIVKAVFKVLY